MVKDYRKYDFDTNMADFEPLIPKVIEKIGGVGESDYVRNFEKGNNVKAGDTQLGADSVTVPDFEKLANQELSIFGEGPLEFKASMNEGKVLYVKTSEDVWNAETADEWIHLQNNAEEKTIGVTVDNNEAQEARQGTIKVTAGDLKPAELKVNQEAAPVPKTVKAKKPAAEVTE